MPKRTTRPPGNPGYEREPTDLAYLDRPEEEEAESAAMEALEDIAELELEAEEDFLEAHAPPLPSWWRHARLGTVSGLYAGDMTGPTAGRYALELRIDIDPRYRSSPVLNRVSGDIYRIFQFNLPGGRKIKWRVYRESWIVDNPRVRGSRGRVGITGRVRYWKGTHPQTDIRIVLPRRPFRAVGPAQVVFVERGGQNEMYRCRRKSDSFRSVMLEVDVCESAKQEPVLPSYDTHWHATRPAGTPRRILDVEETYREAGIRMKVAPRRSVINDSAPAFASWSVAELHDAMETYFSQIRGGWPKWNMWGLLAGRFDSAGVAGIMFDAAAAYGGAGEPPDRQGFAVFRQHSWFNDLQDGTPASQAEAAAMRKFLYTWVHEAGHAFNFLHSWDKGRASSLSWMNYDWKYDIIHGTNEFWSNFEFEFDNQELLHIRHGDRNSVIMGGDPWASGGHAEGPSAAHNRAEGEAPLELLVRSKGYFEFLEPVSIELRLRNLLNDIPMEIDSRMDPAYGAVAIAITAPSGQTVEFEPVAHMLGEAERVTLKPANSPAGEERLSQEVPLTYGKRGHYFTEPGTYYVRAIYKGFGDTLIPSAAHRIRVGIPMSKDEERLANDFFAHDAGLCLTLGGSRSPHLDSGMKVLEDIATRYKDNIVGAKVASILAQGVSRPFFRVDEKDRTVKETAKADPARALALTSNAIKLLKTDETANIAYSELVCHRAALLSGQDKADTARKELSALRKDLQLRDVKKPVLDDIASFEKNL